MAKGKRKLGALDIILICGVLLIVAGVAYYFTHNNVGNSASSSGKYDVSYILEVKEVPEDFDEQVIIGDDVYYTESNTYIGKVEAVEVIPYYSDYFDASTGHMDTKAIDGKYNARLTISAQADISESATSVNDVDVMVGSGLGIHTSTVGGLGYCIQLEEASYGD